MLEIRILTGLHRGAALPLEGETIRIGSGAENDIVLLDPGMPSTASVIDRSGQSAWLYRSNESTQPGGKGDGEAHDGSAGGTILAAGARWFAGPVLIGCEDECTPWLSESVQSRAPQGGDRGKRPLSVKRKLCAMLVAAIGLTAVVALLAWRGHPAAAPRSGAAQAPFAKAAPDAVVAPVRVIKGTLYPNETIGRPPFAIRSASGGPYGFVVTDDDQVLIPGSRWRSFTLVRIEPGRAVFTGPHAAELTW